MSKRLLLSVLTYSQASYLPKRSFLPAGQLNPESLSRRDIWFIPRAIELVGVRRGLTRVLGKPREHGTQPMWRRVFHLPRHGQSSADGG